jgi:hypothetical protein
MKTPDRNPDEELTQKDRRAIRQRTPVFKNNQNVTAKVYVAEKLARLAAAEKLALSLQKSFAPLCIKLTSLKPQVEKMRDLFAELVKGSVTIAGCKSFGEFCEKKLGRKRQTVYEMLGDYKKKQRHAHKKKKGPQLVLQGEDQERLITAANAAQRHFDALDANDADTAQKAKREFQSITSAKALAARIDGDQPNYLALLVEVLDDINTLSGVPEVLTRKFNAIRKRLGLSVKKEAQWIEGQLLNAPEELRAA